MGTALSVKQFASPNEESMIPRALKMIFESVKSVAKEYVTQIKASFQGPNKSFCQRCFTILQSQAIGTRSLCNSLFLHKSRSISSNLLSTGKNFKFLWDQVMSHAQSSSYDWKLLHSLIMKFLPLTLYLQQDSGHSLWIFGRSHMSKSMRTVSRIFWQNWQWPPECLVSLWGKLQDEAFIWRMSGHDVMLIWFPNILQLVPSWSNWMLT